MTTPKQHQPVLLEEIIAIIAPHPEMKILDATFGRGGHTQAFLDAGAAVTALDVDSDAIEYGKLHFAQYLSTQQLKLIQSNFSELDQLLDLPQFDCIFFDFGASTDQLLSETRGFSFASQEKVDMRMDKSLGVTAHDLLMALPEKELLRLFQEYGGEERSRAIAKKIVATRIKYPETEFSGESLAELISKIKPRTGKLHPATKVFQALRIAVNLELDHIQTALPAALNKLKPNGKLLTIAFHEGEDRIVKHQFVEWQTQKLGQIITKKPITTSQQEQQNLPNARSAKLRVFEKGNNET